MMARREAGASRIRAQTSQAIGRAGGALGQQGVSPMAARPAEMAAAGAIGPALAGYEAEMEKLATEDQRRRMERREQILGELFGGTGRPERRRVFGFMGKRGRGYSGLPRATTTFRM